MLQISDLLKPERSNLTIREDKKRGVFVEGLSEWVSTLSMPPFPIFSYLLTFFTYCGIRFTLQVVRSPAEIYGLMERGGAVRATGETKMN